MKPAPSLALAQRGERARVRLQQQQGQQQQRRRWRQTRGTAAATAASPPPPPPPPLDNESSVAAYIAARPELSARVLLPTAHTSKSTTSPNSHSSSAAETAADALSVRLLPTGAINWVWAVTAAAPGGSSSSSSSSSMAGNCGTRIGGALPACGLLLKHAPPYVRSAGPSFPLSTERLRVEAAAMRWAAALCPGLVPAPLHFDAAASALVAPLLPPQFVPLGGAALDLSQPPLRLPRLPGKLAGALARLYAATSPASLGREGHALARAQFANADMVAANAAVVLERPFDAAAAGNAPLPELAGEARALRADKAAMKAVARARAAYSGSVDSSSVDSSIGGAAARWRCLIHGDLHAGNCLVAPPRGRPAAATAALVDFEMAAFGPPGYDLGTLAASLMMAAIAAAAIASEASTNMTGSSSSSSSSHQQLWREQAAWLLTAAEQVVDATIDALCRRPRRHRGVDDAAAVAAAAADAKEAAAALYADALLFAAVAMCRLTVGGHKFDGFAGLPSYGAKVRCERAALQAGRALLRHCAGGGGGGIDSMRIATDVVRQAIKDM